jgi:hypothetical protein
MPEGRKEARRTHQPKRCNAKGGCMKHRKNKDADAIRATVEAAGFQTLSEKEMEESFGPFGPAPDAREQVRRWDAGKTIWTISMGGMGPGYEQAIQILAVEITRDWLDKPLPPASIDTYAMADATIARIDAKQPDGSYACGGFSGAQVGAASWLAYHWLTDGPAKVHKNHPTERHIQASKFWPKAPEVKPHA